MFGGKLNIKMCNDNNSSEQKHRERRNTNREVGCDLGLRGTEGETGWQRGKKEHSEWEEQNGWELKSGRELV